MTYRESDAFRASHAKTVRKRYWRDPEKERQRRRDYRKRKARERERAVFLLSRGKRQDPARGTGPQPDFPHHGGNVGGSLDTFERRGHGRKP